jgi:outer membrane protein assembly factor BamB
MEIFSVVPIFTSAGAALLPTILAATVSIVAVLFRPRELWRIVSREPMIFGISAGAVAFSVVLIGGLLVFGLPFRAAPHSAANATVTIDWAKVAEDIIAKEQSGVMPTSLSLPDERTADTPLVLGRDFARCFYGGGSSPVKLKPRWTFRPEETMFLSSPVVAGNRIFVAGCQSDLGGYLGLLAAIDMETGKPIWQVTEMNDEPLRAFFSSPALTKDGKYLIIGQGLHADNDCSLLCFDAASGKLRWAVKTSLHIESSPAIFGDMAVVGAGAIERTDGVAATDPGFVFAVRINDGKELWRQPVNDPESSPAIDKDGVIYIGSGCNGNAVVALRSESEEELRERKLDRIIWRKEISLPVTSAITLIDDLAIAGAGNGDFVQSNQAAKGVVVAFDRQSGEIRWQTPFNDAVLGVIAGRDNMLLCPSRTGEVAALAAKDGRVLWRTRISGDAPVLAGCAFTGQCIYAVSSDGYLAVLNPQDGKILAKTYLNDQAKPGSGLSTSSPMVIGGCIIAGSETGGLHCFGGSDNTP